MKPKISIALCTYNGAKFLSSQLESYLVQTRRPDEVVVCDDRSNDQTVGILKAFAERAPFLVRVLVNDQNLGSTKNFEKAISLCSGEFIFLSDQDDIWNPDKIEKMVGAFENDPDVGLVFSDVELVDESSTIEEKTLFSDSLSLKEREMIENGDLFSVLLNRDVVIGGAMSFRSKYSDYILPIPSDIPIMIHDGWIAMAVSAITKTVFLDQPLIKYRQHAGQQTGVTNYIPGVFKLSWKEAMGKGELKHKIRKERLESFNKHFNSNLDIPGDKLKALKEEIRYQQEYARHYRLRKELSDNHTKRLWPVVGELLSGRYHRFSNGIRSAARDMIVDHEQETEFYEIIDIRKTEIN